MAKKSLKLKLSQRLMKKKSRRRNGFGSQKQCRFCANTEAAQAIDFKNATLLKSFLTERGKILPSRISGTCARHQRELASAIKTARVMALVPYTAPQV